MIRGLMDGYHGDEEELGIMYEEMDRQQMELNSELRVMRKEIKKENKEQSIFDLMNEIQEHANAIKGLNKE